MATDGAREQQARDGAPSVPMADPFPSLGGDVPAPAAPVGGAARAREARPDVGSEEAFPALGGQAPARAPAWVSRVPVLQRVTHQARVQLRLEDEQLARLSALLQRVQAACPDLQIEASTTRKTHVTTFILKGPSDARVQAAKKALSAQCARRVSLTVLVPASLRAYVIGAGGKNVKAITDATGVRIHIPPRAAEAPAEASDDPLLDEQVEVVIEGDEVNALAAQAQLEALVAERTSKRTQRLTDIDPAYYPFIAGARNAHAAHLAETIAHGAASVHVPPRGAFRAREDRARDLAIVVQGEREAVAQLVAAIYAEVAEWKAHFRTLTVHIPKRQHACLVGDAAADLLATTGCALELPAAHDATDAVTIRGPQQQLPHALTAALEKASAVCVRTVDLAGLHPGADAAHARRLAQWLALRAPRTPGVHVYFPRADAPPVVEAVGTDAAAVDAAAADLAAAASRVAPAQVRVVDVDPLAHGMVIGKKGHGLRTFEARGVDVLLPPEHSGRADVLLVLGRADGVQRLPAGAARDDAARAVLDAVAAELAQLGGPGAEVHTEQLEIPAQFHKAIVGPDGTVLNAILGEDRVMVLVGCARDARAQQVAPRTLTADSILVRGARDAVERAVAQITQIARDAEHDQIVQGHVEELRVPAAHVPHLIGRGGAGLGRLRDELGVKIDVADADAQRTGPVPIRITGRKECAVEARARLAAHAQRLADEQTAIVEVPAALVGVVIGPGGKYVSRLQDKYDVHIHFPAERGRDAGHVSVRGSKKGVAGARAEILELVAYEQETSHTDTLHVPPAAVPRVLGRAGATINQLRLDTGAQIDLERKDGGATLRLRGTRAAVDAARAALDALLAQVAAEATHTLHIPPRFHGTLIGAGGQHLRALIVAAGGPEDARAQAQYVRFPRGGDSDAVVVRAPKEVAARIAAALEAEAQRLADRAVLGAAVPPHLHRQLVSRGGTRQSAWQTQHGVAIVLPTWREYDELGTPANADALADAAAPVVKVVGPAEAVPRVLDEIAALCAADQARKQRAAAARIDA
ncbi:hypothetical protein MBRA1_002291 [Malassezia brasiliensis]|uniref:K Homology domain-containing protein n=1 Tax=Malassezia brasiliensis TaxID=1821822 RepID=A0AAF0INZ1_9BASI|nr:hypothetical protein MBRA1_002291 [Malassezia brasiliensis]